MVARSCLRCGVPIPRGSRCMACKPRPANKPANSHYKDPEYIRNRRLMIDDCWRMRIPCWICGTPFKSRRSITADHIIPLSKGGSHKLSNLAPAHFRCNSARGATLLVLPESQNAPVRLPERH